MGYIVGNGVKKVDPEKTKCIKEWKTPDNPKCLQRFLGLCNWVRDFIENFSREAKPLYELLKDDAEWRWTKD